jgi:hypothetical protein
VDSVAQPHRKAVESIVDRLFLEERNIRKFKTGVVLNRVKAPLAIPIE